MKEIIKRSMRIKNTKSLTITSLFPWICEFKSMCKVIYENYNMTSLKDLMQYYMR